MQTNPVDFPKHEATIFIRGPEGPLEAKTAEPKHAPKPVTVIVCHPHPQFEGTMENKVVTTVFRALRRMGARVVRFNYRGVGCSEGMYAAGIGEADDLLAIIQWVKEVRSEDQIWLVGFSFGAYVAVRVAAQVSAKQLLTIAPSVDHFDFDSLVRPSCPWLVIQGDADEVIDSEAVFQWVAKQAHPPKLVKVVGVGHFFHGRLVDLQDILIAEYATLLEQL